MEYTGQNQSRKEPHNPTGFGACSSICFWCDGEDVPAASFTKEVNSRLAKRPFVVNGHLANRRLTSFVKEATGSN